MTNEKIKLQGVHKANFGEPDTHGEILAHVPIALPRPERDKVVYLDISVNGGEAQEYHLVYNDSGTMGYARMNGEFAVHGRLTNVSKDSHKKPFFVINLIGSMKVDTPASLVLWGKAESLLK